MPPDYTQLQNAVHLSSRPPLHCTSFTLAVFGLVLTLAHLFHRPSLHRLSWILAAAVLSHHLRDADVFELEIFSLVTGCFSVLAVIILAIVVKQLSVNINRMKRQMALQTRTDQHSFHNPTIQPNEELAKRGFSMYRGQDDGRATNMPQKDEYFGNSSSHLQQPAYRY